MVRGAPDHHFITMRPVEKVGGKVTPYEHEDDTLYLGETTTPTLVKTLSFSTPDPLGSTVLKYALQCSIRIDNNGYESYVRVDLDDEEWFTVTLGAGVAPEWADRSKEVKAGSHTLKFYVWGAPGTSPTYPAELEAVRVICGIGTISTIYMKVASISTTGDAKLGFRIMGKAWKETDPTISGEGIFDDDPLAMVEGSVTVITGGTKYSVEKTLRDFALEETIFYAKTSNTRIAVFFEIEQVILERMVRF